jgi:hypothetical protein
MENTYVKKIILVPNCFELTQKLQIVALEQHTFGSILTISRIAFAVCQTTRENVKSRFTDENVRLRLKNADPNIH